MGHTGQLLDLEVLRPPSLTRCRLRWQRVARHSRFHLRKVLQYSTVCSLFDQTRLGHHLSGLWMYEQNISASHDDVLTIEECCPSGRFGYRCVWLDG